MTGQQLISMKDLLSRKIIIWFWFIMVMILVALTVNFIIFKIERFLEHSHNYISGFTRIVGGVLDSYKRLVDDVLARHNDYSILRNPSSVLWFVVTEKDRVVESTLEGLKPGSLFSPLYSDKSFFTLEIRRKTYFIVSSSYKDRKLFVAINFNRFKPYVFMASDDTFIISPDGRILMATDEKYLNCSIVSLGFNFAEIGQDEIVNNYAVISLKEKHGLTVVSRKNLSDIVTETFYNILPFIIGAVIGTFILSLIISRVITKDVLTDLYTLVEAIGHGDVESVESNVEEIRKIKLSIQELIRRFENLQNMLLVLTSYNFNAELEKEELFIGILRNIEDYVLLLFPDKLLAITYYVRKEEVLQKVYETHVSGNSLETSQRIECETLETLSEDIQSVSFWERNGNVVRLFIPLRDSLEKLKILVVLSFREPLRKIEMYAGNLLAVAFNVVVEHAEAMYNFNMLATTDYLTGLRNRQYFIQRLYEECERAKRYGGEKTFAVSMIDVDGLKKINDTYGHEAGDELLKTFARFLKSILRKSDVVGRIGGDEFSVIWLNVTEEDVPKIEKKFLDELSKVKLEKYNFPLSASIGTAVYGKDGESPNELLNVADARMYAMKSEKKKKQREKGG